MSRNLLRTTCARCDGKVRIVGHIRVEQYRTEGYYVADAECEDCCAQYAAWLGEPGQAFHDLSYRSTFNDEPGPTDLPGKVSVYRLVIVDGVPKALRPLHED